MFARVKSLIKRKKAQALEMTVEKELQQEQQSPAPPAQGNAAATRQVKEAAAAPATTKNTQVAAEKYIEHERQRKQQLPVYPGLERFDIIEKLGEYVVKLATPPLLERLTLVILAEHSPSCTRQRIQ